MICDICDKYELWFERVKIFMTWAVSISIIYNIIHI